MKNKVAIYTSSKNLRKRLFEHRMLYVFLLPTIIYLIIFSYIPMYGVLIAFKKYNPAFGVFASKWVGLKHFKDFVASYFFWPIMRNTLTISVYSLIIGFPITITLALMLNEIRNKKYKKFVQTLLYAPYFISMVVMVGIIVLMLSPSIGVINHLLEIVGLERYYFLINPAAFKHIYVWTGVWKGTGWGAIIYLAALAGVDPELHEAATIDGASKLQRIWHINIPKIQPTIVILLILSIQCQQLKH